jgi:prepilin-type N-terminal cleavage/methylation domain-containing protein
MKKGFTLIELLVVLAIIGIISSIVLSSIFNCKENGCEENGLPTKVEDASNWK